MYVSSAAVMFMVMYLSDAGKLVKGASVIFPAEGSLPAADLHLDVHFPLKNDGSLSLNSATAPETSRTPLALNHPVAHPIATTYSTPSATNSSTPTNVQRKNGNNCYFPSEYQGIYQVQSSIDPMGRVQYDEVEIGPQDVSVWGTCHSLTGHILLLHISTESGDCFRCFHIMMRTPTILQVNTEGLEKCYTSENTARSKCPATIRPGDGIFLWRKSGSIDASVTGSASQSKSGQNIYRALCPLDGEFTFTYYLNGSPLCETGNLPASNLQNPNTPTSHIINRRNVPNNDPNDLDKPLSIISNCPSRDILHATFRSCSFSDRETTFKCLGTWPGENGQTYIGLMDFYDDSYAKYRCALYKEEQTQTYLPDGTATTTSTFHVSLSPDSTCSTELYNATYGFETLELFPIPRFDKRKIKAKIRDLKRKLSMENVVGAGGEEQDASGKPFGRMLFAAAKTNTFTRTAKKNFVGTEGLGENDENITCRFPDWMQGEWQYFDVKADDLIIKNPSSSQTVQTDHIEGILPPGKQQLVCVGREVKVAGREEKILLYSQTSCGEESVTCLWARKREDTMMEFRKGEPVPIHDATLLRRQVPASGDFTTESTSAFPPFDICEDSFFYDSPWITQISLSTTNKPQNKDATCPFHGELEAELGHGEKCDVFSSHCGTADIFEYKKRTCKTPRSHKRPHEIFTYDERHYRCVSSWNDQGYTLFLTERLKSEEMTSNGLGFDELSSNRSRDIKNRTSSTVETQCFIMKALPKENSYLVASLGSNCKQVAAGVEEFLKENGLRFRLTANCSSTWPVSVNVSNELPFINDIPGIRKPPGNKFHQGHTNETSENFNLIPSAQITSGSLRNYSVRNSFIHLIFVMILVRISVISLRKF